MGLSSHSMNPEVRNVGTNHLLMVSLRTLTTEGMNGPRAGDDLATMPESARNEVFFSGFDRNASVTKNQGIAALDDHHTWCGLTTGCDLVCNRLHELRKTFHRFYP